MSRLYKRGRIWWCWYYDASGKRVRTSTQRTNRRAAEEELRRLEREAAAGRDPTRARSATVGEAVIQLLENGLDDVAPATFGMYEQKAVPICRLMGGVTLHELHVDDLTEYTRLREEEGIKPHTVHKELTTIRRALTFAHQRGDWDRTPASVMPRYRARYVPKERFLTQDEYARLRAQLPSPRRLWLAVAVYTGGRSSIIETMDWQDVEWSQHRVHVRGTKTEGSDRYVPLFRPLRTALWRHRQSRGPIVGRWSNVRRDLALYCGKADIEPVSPNDLRRTFCTWGADAGIAESDMVAYMGHGSTKMVRQVYRRLHRGNFAAAATLMPNPGGESL